MSSSTGGPGAAASGAAQPTHNRLQGQIIRAARIMVISGGVVTAASMAQYLYKKWFGIGDPFAFAPKLAAPETFIETREVSRRPCAALPGCDVVVRHHFAPRPNSAAVQSSAERRQQLPNSSSEAINSSSPGQPTSGTLDAYYAMLPSLSLRNRVVGGGYEQNIVDESDEALFIQSGGRHSARARLLQNNALSTSDAAAALDEQKIAEHLQQQQQQQGEEGGAGAGVSTYVSRGYHAARRKLGRWRAKLAATYYGDNDNVIWMMEEDEQKLGQHFDQQSSRRKYENNSNNDSNGSGGITSYTEYKQNKYHKMFDEERQFRRQQRIIDEKGASAATTRGGGGGGDASASNAASTPTATKHENTTASSMAVVNSRDIFDTATTDTHNKTNNGAQQPNTSSSSSSSSSDDEHSESRTKRDSEYNVSSMSDSVVTDIYNVNGAVRRPAPPNTVKYASLVIEASKSAAGKNNGGTGSSSSSSSSIGAFSSLTDQTYVRCRDGFFGTTGTAAAAAASSSTTTTTTQQSLLDLVAARGCQMNSNVLAANYHRLMLGAFALQPSPMPTGLRVTQLGVGGGALSMFVQKYFNHLIDQLDLVDVEPACFEAAAHDLGLRALSRNVAYHATDAEEFLLKSADTAMKHDVILLDTFVGSDVPPHLTSEAFIRTLFLSLSATGSVAINLPFRDREFVSRVERVFAEQGGGQVYCVPVRKQANYVVLATKSPRTTVLRAATKRQVMQRATVISQEFRLPYDLGAEFPITWMHTW